MTAAATTWDRVLDEGTWRAVDDRERPLPLPQSWEWGEARRASGARVYRFAAALDRGPVGVQLEFRAAGRVAWAPGGPIGPGVAALAPIDLTVLARSLRRLLLVAPHRSVPGRAVGCVHYLPGTSYVSLGDPDPTARARMSSRWRNCLSKAERSGLEVEDGGLDDLLVLEAELATRKSFRPPYQAPFYAALAEAFGSGFRIRRTRLGAEVVGVWADAASGSTALYLAGATSPAGRPVNASYLLAHDAVGRLGTDGRRFLDLGGVNPGSREGVDHFKRGLGGEERAFPGVYAFGLGSRALSWGAIVCALRSRAT